MIKAGKEREVKGEAGNPQHPEESLTATKDVLQEAQQGVNEALAPRVEVDPAGTLREEVDPLAARIAVDVQLLGETLRRVEGPLEIKVKVKETEIGQA